MNIRIIAFGMWIALTDCFMFFPAEAITQELTSPFGQSNAFVLKINHTDSSNPVPFAIPDPQVEAPIPVVQSLVDPAARTPNPRITISFNVGISGQVDLGIYDLEGNCIKNVVSQQFEVGNYSEQWDGLDEHGNQVSSGVYLIQVKDESSTSTKRITFEK